MKKTSDTFEYAVIGAGLSGLCIANSLARQGKNVVLIEAADFAGGHNKQINSQTGAINNGLRILPNSSLAIQSLEFLQNLCDVQITSEVIDAAPLTVESGELRPFVGFGDNTPTFFDEINYFNMTERIEPSLPIHQWTQLLAEKFTGTFMPRSYVTKFFVENNEITHVMINGSKQLSAENYVFCGAVKDLSVLLPEDSLTPRARQKLAKGAYWTALCLDIFHNHLVTESDAIHMLNGTTQDEIGPCAGYFHPPITKEERIIQHSQWITFIDQEVAEDSEIVAASLKKIKRQIKRAYPTALDNIVSERILVAPNYAGNGELKLSGNQSLPQACNLWIGSSPINAQKNILGSLLQAQLVLAALDGSTQTKEILQSESPIEQVDSI